MSFPISGTAPGPEKHSKHGDLRAPIEMNNTPAKSGNAIQKKTSRLHAWSDKTQDPSAVIENGDTRWIAS